ncbi:MAG: OadG family transporter subunit [Bacillota bacterium]
MLQEGLFVTVVGLVVVFVTLWLLSGVLSAMKLFSGVETKRSAQQEAKIEAHPAVEPTVEEEAIEAGDDLELVAVISAAVAAALGRETQAIRVASIRRVIDLDRGWAAAGRNDVIGSRL